MNSRLLKPLGFISHSELGGSAASSYVGSQFNHPDLQITPFFSKWDIVAGDEIVEEILTNIVNADLLIGIIDPNAKDSVWVEWEHRFCKERNLRVIPIVFHQIWKLFTDGKIDFINSNTLAIRYEEKDMMLADVYASVKKFKAELQKRIEEKEKISIEAEPDKEAYHENEVVKITGNVTDSGMSTPNSFTIKKAYLHKPNFDSEKKYPPVLSNEIVESIILNADNTFEITHTINSSILLNQKWFIEIRFDNKSKIIPIIISPSGGKKSTIFRSESKPKISNTLQIKQKSWQDKIKSISLGTFQSIPKKIRDYSIPRKKELESLSDAVENHDRVVIIGDKGTGKSVLLCDLYQSLKKKNQDVLFLRCDDYLQIESISDLQKIIDEEMNLDEIVFNSFSESKRLTIILDSLDAISRNTKAIGIFKQFLKLLWGTDRVKTVCSVRKYDYEYSPSITSTDWGFKYSLDEISEEQLQHTLDYLDKPKISNDLRDILRNPLHLKLLAMILDRSPHADFTQITSEVELYNEHWREYVEKSEHMSEIRDTLFSISQLMMANRRYAMPYEKIPPLIGLNEALRSNIIEEDKTSRLIQFFHHAYFDYVLSRYVLQEYDNLITFLSTEQYNIFLRPTIVFTLSILHNQNFKDFLTTINNILLSDLKYYWKISALHTISKIRELKVTDVTKFGEIVDSDYSLQRHFLREITKENNAQWFEIWKDTIIKKWIVEKDWNERYLLDYVKSVSTYEKYHLEIFQLLQAFVAKSRDEWAQKTAVEITSQLKVEKFDWYLQLSQHPSSYVRWGVLESLTNIIEINPKNIHKIFVNIFLYEEKSDDKTMLPPHGSLVMTSNKKQDNRQVKWLAGELFPKLLEKNPNEMILAVIRIIESLRHEYLESQKGDVVEDGGSIWYDVSNFRMLHDESQLLSQVQNYLMECNLDELDDLLPILTKSKLATIHRVAMTVMLNQISYFKDHLYKEITNPEYYTIDTLEPIVRSTIKKISKLLTKDQIQQLLIIIMNVKLPSKRADADALRFLEKLKAGFLSEFPTDVLKDEHKKLLAKFPKKHLEYTPSYSFSIQEGKPLAEIPKPTPEKVIDEKFGKPLTDRNERIELLDSMTEYLGKKTEELDKKRLAEMKDYLLSQINDPDPEDNAKDEDPSFMSHHSSIRGITARCLLRLYYHTKNTELAQPIERLSEDKTNIVRGDVARELRYLFFTDYPLTLKITTRYSHEESYRVQFFLTDIVSVMARKHPQDTVALIKNILSVNKLKNFQQIQFHEDVIVYLALIQKNTEAKEFLNELIKSKEFSKEVKENIPFILKESYFFNNETQDDSLQIILSLLDDENHEVREKATFFLLYPLQEKKANEITSLMPKISQHLDKIACEIEREQWDLRIVEELIQFLEKHWPHIPDKSLEYMERISNAEKKYLTFQPMIARGIIAILNGLFREYKLSSENREKCLNILDKFSMVGWPEALNLLAVMERPD